MVQELENSTKPNGDNEKKPFFETAKGVFRVTLPNRNEGIQKLSKPRKRLVAVYRQRYLLKKLKFSHM